MFLFTKPFLKNIIKPEYGCALLLVCFILASAFTLVSHASVVSKPSQYNINLQSGLIAWWTMDGADVLNGVALDKSGNSKNGNLINIATTTFYKAGKIGQAFNFDGSNDYIKASSDIIGMGASTTSAWIYARSYGQSNMGRIIDNGKFILEATSTNSTFGFSSDGFTTQAVAATNALPLNKWVHIVITRNPSGTANFYINGVLSGTANQSSGTPIAGTTNVIVGNISAANATFDGLIDDVRIYNRALSATEVKQLYNMGQANVNKTPTTNTDINSGLLGWWTFDGKDLMNNVVDKSGSGNTGYMINMATSTAKTVGKMGQALNFDGI